MKKLQKTSETVTALDPSQEFPYTWIDLLKAEVGMFFRTEKEAFEDAKTNFHDFTISCNVIIVRAVSDGHKPLEDGDEPLPVKETILDDSDEDEIFRKLLKKRKKNKSSN